MPRSIWLNVIKNLLKKLEANEDILEMYSKLSKLKDLIFEFEELETNKITIKIERMLI